jgi:hypothetical protein
MITTKAIREELKDIRYYMSRKASLDKNADNIGKNSIEERIAIYNKYVCDESPRLYDLYISLYLNNNTQESLSCILGYSIEHISRLNTKLIKFFQQKFIEDGCE